MILGATFLPNPANTLESWWRDCRALVANSQTRQRYSDIEEVQIARMGSVHAGCPLFPLHLYPSDTTRERPTRAGIERLRHNSRHSHRRSHPRRLHRNRAVVRTLVDAGIKT